jgi:cobalamin biosynthesis protein CobD/CbiB
MLKMMLPKTQQLPHPVVAVAAKISVLERVVGAAVAVRVGYAAGVVMAVRFAVMGVLMADRLDAPAPVSQLG